jgi:UDP-glucose:(heptosyl)LPS alpha-1,3-glucosyltransferase
VRIAFVVHDYNRTHGHSRYVVELAERFAAEHEVHVFAASFENLPGGIVGHRVPAVRASALLSIFSFFVPATLMVGREFDIVHAQGMSMLGAGVITAHISNERWLEGRRLLEEEGLSWKERLFGALVIPAERHVLRDPNATVIAISKALRADLARQYGRTGDTAVIPHGVDRRQFNPDVRARFREQVRAELGLGAEDVLFLYVGDLRKGFVPAMQALAHVPGARMVGVSRTGAAPFIATAGQLGIASRVDVRPATSQIERYYASADALVLPTPYDAFGMVITEAMACGLPVVTTKLAGASELVVPGVHGLVVESPADIVALSNAMRMLAVDRPGRERMGAAAAALMSEHTWDRVAERTLEVYRRHLETRGARGTA